jgi:hypothetical protein
VVCDEGEGLAVGVGDLVPGLRDGELEAEPSSTLEDLFAQDEELFPFGVLVEFVDGVHESCPPGSEPAASGPCSGDDEDEEATDDPADDGFLHGRDPRGSFV